MIKPYSNFERTLERYMQRNALFEFGYFILLCLPYTSKSAKDSTHNATAAKVGTNDLSPTSEGQAPGGTATHSLIIKAAPRTIPKSELGRLRVQDKEKEKRAWNKIEMVDISILYYSSYLKCNSIYFLTNHCY